MAELNVKDPESSFTIDDWAAAAPEEFEIPKEVSDAIHEKAVELVNMCIEHNVPALVHFIAAQDPMAHHCRTVCNLMPLGRTSVEMLVADYAVRHGAQATEGILPLLREGNNKRYQDFIAPDGVEVVDINDLGSMLRQLFGDK